MISRENTTSDTSAPDSAVDFEYKLLTGHHRTDGSFKTDEQLRMEYVNLTDNLIYEITDGVDIFNPETKKYEKKTPDTVIFLDKSARPVSWLMKEMWPKFATDANGETAEMPDIRYLNIDREQWVNTVDPEGIGHMNIDKVDKSVIRSLRSVFVEPKDKENGLTEELDTAPTELDGKTVLVVDEVLSSGRTLDIAKKMIQRAFPNTDVATTHWMKGVTTRNNGMSVGNADLPIWYKSDDEYGRGVGNRLRDPSDSTSKNMTQRLGRWFLSQRLPRTDESANQLRKELKHLATDESIPVRPSLNRQMPDYLERVERLNGVDAKVANKAIRDVLDQ